MKRHTRSILQELQEYSQTTANAKELVIEDRAKHAIAEATDIIQEINSNFSEEIDSFLKLTLKSRLSYIGINSCIKDSFENL